MSPVAGYDDFESCVRANQDKRDPEAYCAVIMHKTEHPAYKRNEQEIAKIRQHFLFGRRNRKK